MTETIDTSKSPPQASDVAEVTNISVVEALLLATDSPLTGAKIAQILGSGTARDVATSVEELNERYANVGCSFRIQVLANGFQMTTLPDYDPWVGKLHKARAESRLSTAALETLAIVAYKQPVLRADVEVVRGVAVGDMLVRLRDMNLVKIVGRAEEIGRPLLYGTTNKFLEVFGISSTKDLPPIDTERPNDIPSLKVVSDEVDSESSSAD